MIVFVQLNILLIYLLSLIKLQGLILDFLDFIDVYIYIKNPHTVCFLFVYTSIKSKKSNINPIRNIPNFGCCIHSVYNILIPLMHGDQRG